jgi:hypothetical protein
MSSALPFAPVAGAKEERGLSGADEAGAAALGALASGVGGLTGADAAGDGAVVFAFAPGRGVARSEFVSGAICTGAVTETEPSGALIGAVGAGVTG